MSATTPWRLKDLVPARVVECLARRPALIVPVGSTEQHGAHLPLGIDTILVERLADDLSARFGILRAPSLEYAANRDPHRPLPGSAPLGRKTLHRLMNELVEAWELGSGVREFLLVTAEGHEAHQEALSTLLVTTARVQVVDIFALDFGPLLEQPGMPAHGGELDTALCLHIAPHLVRMEAAEDTPRARPSLASADKGARLYEFILDRIAVRCLHQES
jgi:creatinine amidohydrolase/Fe(II)-dependent formamide hydrolase-like protein